jgi:hypothetical protein
VRKPPKAVRECNHVKMANHAYPCACCRYLTRETPETDTYDICPVCFWEENELQTSDPEAVWVNKVCLIEARANFPAFGACEPEMLKHVRPPLPEEIPQAK